MLGELVTQSVRPLIEWLNSSSLWPLTPSGVSAQVNGNWTRGEVSTPGYCLLLFCVLATSEVISGRVPTCDSAHSWWFNSAAPLGDQATRTMIWYCTQSHYPDPEPISPCPVLNNAEHLARKRQLPILKSSPEWCLHTWVMSKDMTDVDIWCANSVYMSDVRASDKWLHSWVMFNPWTGLLHECCKMAKWCLRTRVMPSHKRYITSEWCPNTWVMSVK